MKKPVRVAVTGSAGQIAYSLIFRIASGEMLGFDQPVILHLLELPVALPSLKGVVMELEDCAFPLVQNIIATDDNAVAFKDVDYAVLVGAKPRGPGMERGDLLRDNANIFIAQGKAINEYASRSIKVLVVGNPANTNAYIAQQSAPDIDPQNFTSMMRLDHNRALSQIAIKTNSPVTEVRNMIVWGNHSATQYPDIRFATAKGDPVANLVESEWVRSVFIPSVQQRGAAIINARGKSSAASAAHAALEHMRDWILRGTAEGDWVSMGITSDGSYGIPEGVMYSFPVTIDNGQYTIVQNLEIDAYSREKMDLTLRELEQEKAFVTELLKKA